jgi:hypothetical protein
MMAYMAHWEHRPEARLKEFRFNQPLERAGRPKPR